MNSKPSMRHLSILLLLAVLALTGCGLRLQPTPSVGPAPTGKPVATPIVTVENGGVDNPDAFVDPAVFQAALFKALLDRDGVRLQGWMTDPFLTGTWRADTAEVSPAEAVKSLFAEQLGSSNKLAPVQGVDLKALMGGKDPLSIPRSDSGVMEAFLVGGWGKDGLDEAILFITRLPADDLKWGGWLQIKGGFSGARLGGVKPYVDDANGYSLYVPKDFQVSGATPTQIDILAPVEAEPGVNRAAAFLFVEPAKGQTPEQIVEGIKSELGSGFNIYVDTKLDIEGEPALTVKGIPAQDPNLMFYVVHKDTLYRIMFWTDDPQAPSYPQMKDLYAIVVNTFHFTK